MFLNFILKVCSTNVEKATEFNLDVLNARDTVSKDLITQPSFFGSSEKKSITQKYHEVNTEQPRYRGSQVSSPGVSTNDGIDFELDARRKYGTYPVGRAFKNVKDKIF